MLEARAQLYPWSKRVDIALILPRGDHYSCAEQVVMTDRSDGEMVTPAFSLEPKAVQQLMDDLWMCGYRPSEGTGSAGQLSAVEYHLEDMRKLVFQDKG